MKVLIISAAFPPMRAGEADHTLYLSQYLAARGLDIHIVTTKKNVIPDDFPFKVHPIIENWTWSALPHLRRFVKCWTPQAILLMYSGWLYNDHPMVTFIPTFLKMLLPGVSFVTQFEIESISRQFSLPTQVMLKAVRCCAGSKNTDYFVFGTLLRHSDRLIVLSQRHQARFSEQFPRTSGKCIVIPPPPTIRLCSESHGAARQRGRSALGVQSDDFLIAYFGYIYANKGVETLLRAFQMVSNQRSNVRLLMIGGNVTLATNLSYVHEMYGLGKTLGIADKVIWTGEYASDSDEASMYLYSADACVFPFNDGVTLNRSSLGAAAAHGLPIVTTEGMSVESPFIHQENMLLCPPQDPRALALALDALISNPALRQRLHMGALALAHEWFSWDKAVERTVEALKRENYARAK